MNSGGNRHGWRLNAFEPVRSGGDPTLNGCRCEFVRKFCQHNTGNNHSLEESRESPGVSDQDQVI